MATGRQAALRIAKDLGRAIVATAGAPGELGPVILGSDGAHAQLVVADRETQLLAMDGHETFKQAVRRLAEASTAACDAAAVSLRELDLYVYHQANTRILASLAERLEHAGMRVLLGAVGSGFTWGATVVEWEMR